VAARDGATKKKQVVMQHEHLLLHLKGKGKMKKSVSSDDAESEEDAASCNSDTLTRSRRGLPSSSTWYLLD
jgi:hypothetical protein